MPDWEDIRYFLALARAGTLSAAARALKVNHATVARRVAAFEATDDDTDLVRGGDVDPDLELAVALGAPVLAVAACAQVALTSGRASATRRYRSRFSLRISFATGFARAVMAAA